VLIQRPNNKKIFFILFTVVFSLGFISVGQKVKAEDFDYQTAYKDYQYNYNLYNRLHEEYKLARVSYMQYGTLLSEEEAKKAALAMLQARDGAIITYLTALRMRIKESGGLGDSEKESLFRRIDPEVSYFEEHKGKLASVGSLEDFVGDSDEAKERFSNSTEIVFYTSLTNIAIGNTAYERKQIEEIIVNLKSKISDIKLAGDKDVSVFDRFFVEIDNKLQRSREKEDGAKDIIGKSEKSYRKDDKVNYYNDAVGSVQGSYLYLKEIVSYLKEIIRVIKIK